MKKTFYAFVVVVTIGGMHCPPCNCNPGYSRTRDFSVGAVARSPHLPLPPGGPAKHRGGCLH